MRVFIKIILFVFLVSCTPQRDVNEANDEMLSKMKSPVILIGKDCGWPGCNATVKDGDGKIYSFGNMTMLGNTLGGSRNVGDTIK